MAGSGERASCPLRPRRLPGRPPFRRRLRPRSRFRPRPRPAKVQPTFRKAAVPARRRRRPALRRSPRHRPDRRARRAAARYPRGESARGAGACPARASGKRSDPGSTGPAHRNRRQPSLRSTSGPCQHRPAPLRESADRSASRAASTPRPTAPAPDRGFPPA